MEYKDLTPYDKTILQKMSEKDFELQIQNITKKINTLSDQLDYYSELYSIKLQMRR